MKKLIPLLVLCLLGFYACKKEAPKKNTPTQNIPFNQRPVPTLPGANNVVGGAHYICPKKCEGGTSGTQGNCKVCNSILSHNQGFHATPAQTTTASPFSAPPATPQAGPNAAGQYHYTCAKGCTGGKDGPGTCNTCSGTLAHNAAFHN